MGEKLHYAIELSEGETVEGLSVEELIFQRDLFTKWVDKQTAPIKNADHDFKQAFKTAIGFKQGNVNFLKEDSDKAIALLEEGFYFPPRAHGHFTQREQGKGKNGKKGLGS